MPDANTIEIELRRRNTELEGEIAALTRQRDAVVAELESFNYSIAHELRAPLRAIDNFSKILLEEHGAGLDAEGRRLFGVVRRNTAMLGQLIDGMLSLARASQRSLTITDVDLETLAHEVLEELAPLMRDRQVNVHASAPTHVNADTAAMREVLARLLSNAVKFTRQRERAEIEIATHSIGEEVVCCVRDNGVGFEPEYAHKLFGVFQRLHEPDEFEGIGIGLGIVKRLIDAHGGRVWAEGAPDRGAAFYFALPQRADSSVAGDAS